MRCVSFLIPRFFFQKVQRYCSTAALARAARLYVCTAYHSVGEEKKKEYVSGFLSPSLFDDARNVWTVKNVYCTQSPACIDTVPAFPLSPGVPALFLFLWPGPASYLWEGLVDQAMWLPVLERCLQCVRVLS